jgi:N-methylhydantoinase B
MMSSATDVIEFELFRNAVFMIANEMAVTILRTAYSRVLKSVMDYSTALANAEGTVIAQSLTKPCHLGSIPIARRSRLRREISGLTTCMWGRRKNL